MTRKFAVISRAVTDRLTQEVRRDLLRGMSGWVSKLGRRLLFASVVAVFLCVAGCSKKSGAAVVLGKDYVPARPMSVTPNESPSPRGSRSGTGRDWRDV